MLMISLIFYDLVNLFQFSLRLDIQKSPPVGEETLVIY